MSDPLPRLRALCLALPEVTEKVSHGEPTWFVRKVFVTYADHHHDDRVGFWCAAPPGAQEALVAARPDRFFRPPYVGGRGWLGVWLDDDARGLGRDRGDRHRRLPGDRARRSWSPGWTASGRLERRRPGGRRAARPCAVPGGRVEYQDVPGDPARAPLLFLHEGLGSVGLWRGFPERIAAATGRRAVAYSRLGPRLVRPAAGPAHPALHARGGGHRGPRPARARSGWTGRC